MTRPILDLGSWCILRCSSCKTLDLAASLTEAGFEAWSPAETITRRARKGSKREEIRRPLIASFVFARSDRFIDLLALSHSPALNYRVWDSELRRMVTRGHPYFRMFRYLGEIARIPDSQLAALRSLERKRRLIRAAPEIQTGARLRLTEAGFEGLWATVQSSKKSYTRVLVDGWRVPVDFPTWSLRQGLDETSSVHVSGALTEQASTAKAA